MLQHEVWTLATMCRPCSGQSLTVCYKACGLLLNQQSCLTWCGWNHLFRVQDVGLRVGTCCEAPEAIEDPSLNPLVGGEVGGGVLGGVHSSPGGESRPSLQGCELQVVLELHCTRPAQPCTFG